jgi:plastocyanin
MRSTWSRASSSGRRVIRAALAIATVLLSAAGPPAAEHAEAIEIVIEHFAFSPTSVEVAPGDTVTFTNRDITPHTATAVDGSWTTKDITSGNSETITVPKAGDGAYFCRYHPVMKGRLVPAMGN